MQEIAKYGSNATVTGCWLGRILLYICLQLQIGSIGNFHVSLVFINVYYPPELSVGPLVDEKILGETDASVLPFADLVCVIQPITSIQSRWLFNGENVENSPMISARTRVLIGNIFMNGTYGTALFIRDISYLDAGIYSCEVLSGSSPDSRWISATVELKLEGMSPRV